MEKFYYYIFVLVAIIVGFLVFKKVATCLIKTIITIAIVAVLAAIYWLYFCE